MVAGFRRGKEVKLKPAVDEALLDCPDVRDCIVYRRTGGDCDMQAGRDMQASEPGRREASDPAA